MDTENNQFEEFDSEKRDKANFVKKNAAGLIDAAIYIVIYSVLFLSLPREIWDILQEHGLLFILSTFIAYRLISILLLNKTVGMKILKLEFSKEEEDGLTILEKILAAFMVYINGIECLELKSK